MLNIKAVRGILSFAATGLLSCSVAPENNATGRKLPANPTGDQNPDSGNAPDPRDPTPSKPTQGSPSEPTDPTTEDPNSNPQMSPSFSLRSPLTGSTSSDTTPTIVAKGLAAYKDGEMKIFSDAKCTKLIGTALISASGQAIANNIQFKDDRADDGLKQLFVKLENKDDSETSECLDKQLRYTLDTNVKAAKSRFIRAMFKTDPSTTINIGFAAASNSKTDSKIFYDTENHGRDVAAYSMKKTLDKNIPYKGLNNAFANLTNLKPGTTDYFVIQDEHGISPVYNFLTISNKPSDRLSIITGGDSRNNKTPRKNANSLVAKLRPHVVFFGGDMTNLGTDKEWLEWFEDWDSTITPDRHVTPVIVQRGNHEHENAVLENLFDTPPGVYYALNFGGSLLRGYTLNSEASIAGDQTDWFINDLKKNVTARWKLVQYHRPMRPHVANKELGTAQYSSWAKPIFDYKVNLVVESDAHTVKSTWPLEPSSASKSELGFVRNDSRGAVYIGEGCWGAPLRQADSTKAWTRDSDSFNHFNWIFIDQDKMEIRTVKVDNAPEVAPLKSSAIFEIPAGLDLWAPKNGSVITLKPID